MDNNSTNDTDKRNWRERLGVGSKVMPRISEEFSKPVEPSLPAPRSAQPVSVAKPAPMAPRVAPKPAPQAARPQQQLPAQGAKPMQPSSPQPQELLAERLRAQRAAAEKLAEQRVLAARDRAENTRPAASAPTPPLKTTVSGAKPKFSFADDDAKPDATRGSVQPGRPPQRPLQQSPLQPQLSPPRPSLGGERPLGGQTRQTPTPGAYQPQFRPQAPQSYRPIDPATGFPPVPQRSYGNGAIGADARLQQSRLTPEGYRRNGAPEDLGYPATNYDPAQRGISRQDPLRAPSRSVEDDYGDDIFEESPPPRAARRASATDYNQAYRETDDGYGEERRRSSGPWLLLLFLMLAAAAAGAGVWYYQTKIKTASANSSTESTPVVAAPEISAKAAPEQPIDAQPNATGITPSKKQIYDRIIGDKEILGGQVTPTEEVPIQPAATEGNAQQIPQPGTDGQSGSGDALPLPMPPPPGSANGTQGALPAPAGSQTVALNDPALNKINNDSAAATTAAPAIAVPAAPVPGENASAATTTQATPPSDIAPAKEEIVTDDASVVPKKKVVAQAVEAPAKVKPKTKVEKTVALGAAPVVLVAPENDPGVAEVPNTATISNQPAVTQVPPVKKKKTLFGLFNGTNDQVDAATAAPVVPQQQVASIPNPAPEPVLKKTQAAPSTSGASGYYVQLASFKSQAEASAEYGRLKTQHADILGGMSPVINPATVGGSTRYRLAIGPLPSRDDASNVCNSLVAAGERDCLVRKQ
jgi:cell division septation protein DedD